MPDYTLPFPGRELADQELTYDVCYAKILPQDRASIVERAWRKGEQAARDIFVKYAVKRIFSRSPRTAASSASVSIRIIYLETSAISVIIFRDRAVFICILALSACGRRKMV